MPGSFVRGTSRSMKRDLSLFRELLLKLEAKSDSASEVYHFPIGDEDLAIEGSSEDEVSYNLARMLEAGFFADHSEMDGGGGFIFSGISWVGHEYLDAVRDPDVWRKTRESARSVGGLTFGLAKDLATAYVKSEIGAKLGLHL